MENTFKKTKEEKVSLTNIPNDCINTITEFTDIKSIYRLILNLPKDKIFDQNLQFLNNYPHIKKILTLAKKLEKLIENNYKKDNSKELEYIEIDLYSDINIKKYFLKKDTMGILNKALAKVLNNEKFKDTGILIKTPAENIDLFDFSFFKKTRDTLEINIAKNEIQKKYQDENEAYTKTLEKIKHIKNEQIAVSFQGAEKYSMKYPAMPFHDYAEARQKNLGLY